MNYVALYAHITLHDALQLSEGGHRAAIAPRYERGAVAKSAKPFNFQKSKN